MDMREMYLSGMSIHEINSATGIAFSTIRFRLKRFNVLRSIKDSLKIAASKGKLSHAKGIKRTFTDEWKKNISLGQIKRGELTAKGTSLKPSGYMEITRGINKSRGEHVVIIENLIGRRLFANECVHHIDKNRSNNKASNLQLMTRSDHAKLHAIENITKRQRRNNGQFM